MGGKISTYDWIARAQATHGDIYDYSKTVYINSATKVEIICKIHGSFYQNPGSHLKGSGCPTCSGNTKVDNSLFIERAKKVHGEKYDYSKVEYKKMHSRVKIICPEHGIFEQEPNLHFRGAGCPECSRNKKLNTEEFKRKARQVHGTKYNYDFVEYINAKTSVRIVCSIHGEFLQDPYNHLKGRGCAKCSADICGRKRRISFETAISRAIEVHGDKYDYSLVAFETINDKVKIICKEHGIFEQHFVHHLSGENCPKCACQGNRYTQFDFLEKCKRVHGNRYDYSKSVYTVSYEKVEIICPKHGSFFQVAGTHLAGKGCPKCSTSKLGLKVAGFLDKHGIHYETEKKFDWLRLTNMLRLDFYLPDYNVAIECQGMQHFGPVEEWGGQEGFLEDISRDDKKKELCNEHGIKILYFARKQDVPDDWDRYKVFTDCREMMESLIKECKIETST